MPQMIAPLLASATAVGAVAAPGVVSSQQQTKAIKSMTNDVAARDAASAQAVKDAQSVASSQAAAAAAQKMRRMRTASQTVFTNPLGVGGMAATARKVLLGQ